MRYLTGPIRNYAWGSRTALSALQGRVVPSPMPEAELWLGAHPVAPSLVDGVPLARVVAADPQTTLGAAVLDQYGPRLPYLLKVLAAAEPLSLQAHPDAEQARIGFAADEAVSPAVVRNYVDPFHKPELLVAVDEFEALCGFRPPSESAAILSAFEVPALALVVAVLRTPYESAALRGAVELVMHWPRAGRVELVSAVAEAGRNHTCPDEPAFELAARLGDLYPGDVGVVLALLLNHLRLRPDDAVFMPAGNLHAYLRGVGVEIMAASDNVLRGGLTPKHVDVEELLRVLRYEVLADPVLHPVEVARGVVGWDAPAHEFSLTKVVAPAGGSAVALSGAGPRIVVCLAGTAECRAGRASAQLKSGQAVFVDALEPGVEVAAASADPAVVFQAATAA